VPCCEPQWSHCRGPAATAHHFPEGFSGQEGHRAHGVMVSQQISLRRVQSRDRISEKWFSMPLHIYCDQNFLIGIGKETSKYKKRFHRLVAAGKISLVVSLYHWLEMARGSNPANGLALADFVDSLNPLWLRERRILQRQEIAACFFSWLNIQYQKPNPLTSRAELISDLSGAPIAKTQTCRSRDFVLQLQLSAQSRAAINQPYREAAQWRQGIAKGLKKGTLTNVQIQKTNKAYIRGLLPTNTPAGIAVDSGTRQKFLNEMEVQNFPCIAVDFAIDTDGWRAVPHLNWKTFIDQFHVISAFAYVDLIATDDGSLTTMLHRIKPSLKFPTACPITKERFDRLYLS